MGNQAQNATLLYADSWAQWTNYCDPARYGRGVYNLGNDLYAFLSPNGSWHETNTGLIAGRGESLLVDTLVDLPHTQTMLDLMRPLTEKNPIHYVVNTHADGDHWWGNELVRQAEIISSEACYEEMRELSPKALMSLSTLGSLGTVIGNLPGLGRCRRVGAWWRSMLAPYNARTVRPRLPSHRFTGELTLKVGGRGVQLLEVGPMHTRGDILVYVPDAGTLYAGDALFVEVTPVLWAGPLERWIATLDNILQMDVNCIVPGHGPVTDKAGVRLLRDYWLFLDTQVQEFHRAGIPAHEAAYAISHRPAFINSSFSRWDSPERLLINVYTLYRWLGGRTTPPKSFERLRIFAREAEFAAQFPAAYPACLHRTNVGAGRRDEPVK